MSRFIAYAIGSEGWGVCEVDPRRPRRDWPPVTGVAEHIVAFGFVDLHIHGGYGMDFMDADPKGNRRLLEKLRGLGYETVLPTTVTAGRDDVLRAVDALPNDPMVAGFHLEGPFISPVFPGAQPPECIAAVPDPGGPWDEVFDHPLLRVVTLAPELPGALDLVRRLTARGVRVSMGHTNATYVQAEEGQRAGVCQATHTFNAMRPLHHREPGAVGFVLSDADIDAELIADGVHVHPAAAKVLAKCVGPERLMAVSDASPAMGLPAGSQVSLWGQDCVVGEDSVRLARNGALAGSTRALDFALSWLSEHIGPEFAVRATSLNARRALQLDGEPQKVLKLDLRLRLVESFDQA